MTHDAYLEAITAQRHDAARAEREADAAARSADIARQIDSTYKGIAVRRVVSTACYLLSMLLAAICVFALAAGNFWALTISAILAVSGIGLANVLVYEMDRMERGDHHGA